MTKFTRLLIALLFVFVSAIAFAQTVTPNTTLCAAVTKTATSVCLNSTTNVVNQTGLYVDGEFMLVQLTNTQVLAAGPTQVPVSRANRAGNVPNAHNSGAVVWIAYTPSAAVVPGANGFVYSTQMGDIGPCVRTNELYLPHIWPDVNSVRDCVNGYWIDYNPTGNTSPGTTQLSLLAANGAITPSSGNYVITKAGVAALTLAAPTSTLQDGAIIRITSSTANAHTVTATGLLQTGTSSVNVATFAAQAGAGLTLMAYQGKWIVLYSVGITFS